MHPLKASLQGGSRIDPRMGAQGGSARMRGRGSAGVQECESIVEHGGAGVRECGSSLKFSIKSLCWELLLWARTWLAPCLRAACAQTLRQLASPPRHPTRAPALPHSPAPALPRSRIPALPHSRIPALPHSRTPALLHSRTPALPRSRTPAPPHSRAPALQRSRTPALPRSRAPALLHSRTPARPHPYCTPGLPHSKPRAAASNRLQHLYHVGELAPTLPPCLRHPCASEVFNSPCANPCACLARGLRWWSLLDNAGLTMIYAMSSSSRTPY